VSACSLLFSFDQYAGDPVLVVQDDGGDAQSPRGDGAGEPIVYSEFTDPAKWTFFDLRNVNVSLAFAGTGTFDGQYVYLAPTSGVVARFDTTSPFAEPSSWSVTGIPNTTSSFGAAVSGQYVYFAPDNSHLVARFDRQLPFAEPAAWSFAPTYSSSIIHGVLATTESVYFVPQDDNNVVEYKQNGDFDAAGSWTRAGPNKTTSYEGAAVARGGLYLAPNPGANVAARHDQSQPLTSGWESLELRTLDARATQFVGAVTDGRYVYFVPSGGSAAARVDAELPFGGLGSWAFSGVAKLREASFSGGTFDGRFVYFVPTSGSSFVRFDTAGGKSFDDEAAWSAADVPKNDAGALVFRGAAFDGRFVYFLPVGTVVARFDARSPSAIPPGAGQYSP
jgi:hypothetical protein